MSKQKKPAAKGRQNTTRSKQPEKPLWQRLRESRWFGITIAVAAILVGVIIIGLILRGQALPKTTDGEDAENNEGQYQEADYFTEGGYPVHIKQDGNALSIRLDGSKAPDLTWDVTVEPENVVTLEDTHGESGGVRSLMLSPLDTGYARLHCVRTGTSGGRSYEEANVMIEVVVSREINGGLVVSLSDTTQSVSLGGAADSETPYLIKEDSIVFPNGGDWTLTVEHTDREPVVLSGLPGEVQPDVEYEAGDENDEAAEDDEEEKNDDDTEPVTEVTDLYPMIYSLFDSYENGQPYFYASIDPFVYDTLGPEHAEKALQNKLILHSDALNLTERLEIVRSGEGGWYLRRCTEQTPEG